MQGEYLLIEIDGVRVMTDPVFSEYASPFQGIGPRRLHPVPLPLEQMPALDAVLISHDHYDHLDMKAVRYLGSKGTRFFVPLGVGAHLLRWGIPPQQIQEMDWWDSATIKGVQVHCTPARHYSGRKRVDNSTLLSGWLARGPQHSFYYSGDTGYSSHFFETRARLGAVELALLKVGAYGDTWLDIQMDPESAIQAQQDLGAQVLLPVHWATFNLSYHAWDEPIVRTLNAARKAGVQIITPAPGQKYESGKPFENRAWFLQH
jgi:L-ascorbate metabolism protein UlaG (beta-lactamase superfamily)